MKDSRKFIGNVHATGRTGNLAPGRRRRAQHEGGRRARDDDRSTKWAHLVAVFALLLPSLSSAQDHISSRVQVSFNRYHDYDQMSAAMREIADAYPELVELQSIGKSEQGRDMWLAIVNPKHATPHDKKPAMFIDANIHGNEVQGGEVVLYTLWYLTKAYGHNEHLTELMDESAFYLLPMENPDSRAWWFAQAASPDSPRGNQRPYDDDRDGLIDEDGPDDLDSDGSITQM